MAVSKTMGDAAQGSASGPSDAPAANDEVSQAGLDEDLLLSAMALPSLIAPMLPRGSIVFPALLTSELEGIQVCNRKK